MLNLTTVMATTRSIFLFFIGFLLAHSSHGQVFLGKLPKSPTSKQIRFDSKAQGLWWKPGATGRMELHLDSKLIKSSGHPIILASEESVFAGQSLAMKDSELLDLLGLEFNIHWPNLDQFVFNVVKAGSEEKPFYQLIGGHNKMFRTFMASPHLSHDVKLRVVEDLTDFDSPEQVELLELYGQFWSPENPESRYQRLTVRDLVESPWRSIGKIKEARHKLSPLFDDSLAFPEITFGERLYRQLKSTGQNPDRIQTVHQLLEVVRNIGLCSLALSPY
ncbi:hypothetical protein GW916_07645 [bacterium]|nr:hypothetical protein [bacterium]